MNSTISFPIFTDVWSEMNQNRRQWDHSKKGSIALYNISRTAIVIYMCVNPTAWYSVQSVANLWSFSIYFGGMLCLVQVSVLGGRSRDRRHDLLVIRDNGNSFRIVHGVANSVWSKLLSLNLYLLFIIWFALLLYPFRVKKMIPQQW